MNSMCRLLILILCFITIPLSAAGRFIVVEGAATRQVVPDQMTIRIQIESQNKSVEAAQKGLQDKLALTMPVILKYQPDKSKLRTIHSEITPVFVMKDKKRIQEGYKGSLQVQVLITELEKAPVFISELSQSTPITRYYQNAFSIKNRSQIEDELLQIALKNAQEKAQALVNAIDMKLGSVLEIHEDKDALSTPPLYRSFQASGSTKGDSVMKIFPGEETIQARITAKFSIK